MGWKAWSHRNFVYWEIGFFKKAEKKSQGKSFFLQKAKKRTSRQATTKQGRHDVSATHCASVRLMYFGKSFWPNLICPNNPSRTNELPTTMQIPICVLHHSIIPLCVECVRSMFFFLRSSPDTLYVYTYRGNVVIFCSSFLKCKSRNKTVAKDEEKKRISTWELPFC